MGGVGRSLTCPASPSWFPSEFGLEHMKCPGLMVGSVDVIRDHDKGFRIGKALVIFMFQSFHALSMFWASILNAYSHSKFP